MSESPSLSLPTSLSLSPTHTCNGTHRIKLKGKMCILTDQRANIRYRCIRNKISATTLGNCSDRKQSFSCNNTNRELCASIIPGAVWWHKEQNRMCHCWLRLREGTPSPPRHPVSSWIKVKTVVFYWFASTSLSGVVERLTPSPVPSPCPLCLRPLVYSQGEKWTVHRR